MKLLSPIVVLLAAGVIAAAPAAGVPEQSPKRGGTVVFGPVAEPGCMRPSTRCGVGLPQSFWEKVLMSAFAVAPDFTMRPALVSEVTFTRTPPFTLTYRIRPEARWSDGVPVTSRDFEFTHRALLREAFGDPADIHTLVRSIRVVNPKTFRVVLRERTAAWRGLFPTVLPRHALAGEDLARVWEDRIQNPKTGRSIGNGPFLVQDWERGRQLTLVRNPRYWGPHTAYLERLIIRFCRACNAPPPADVLESLRTGAVDLTHARDTVNASELRRIPETTVRLYRSNIWEHLTLRLDPPAHPALESKLVRRALAYGIDRAAIVKRLWGTLDPSYPPLHNALLLNTARDYAANWAGYSYRPTLARRLLGRAGCRRGADGIYSCGGRRLTLRFVTYAGVSRRQLTVELMQAQLHRVGIEVELSYGTEDALFGRGGIVISGQFDAAQFAWLQGGNIGGTGKKDLYGCGGDQNYIGYCQRLVTADLDQADRILDDAQRARALNRIDRRLAADVPLIPLYQGPWVLAYKDRLRNVIPSPSSLFGNAEDWWLAEPR